MSWNKTKNLKGKRFGKLIVLSFAGMIPYGKSKVKRAHWNCECDCGNIKMLAATHLLRKTRDGTKSCGCLVNLGGPDEALFRSIHRRYKRMRPGDSITLNVIKRLCILPCHYCGMEPTNVIYQYDKNGRKTGNSLFYSGLDRIDSSKDHTEDNVVPCCYPCNWSKSDRSEEEFREWLTRAYHHFVLDGRSGSEVENDNGSAPQEQDRASASIQ